MMSQERAAGFAQSVEEIAARARAAGVFGPVRVVRRADGADLVECEAAGSAEAAAYRVEGDGGRVWVSLVTANRWLSESIESDLLHTGDKMEDLVQDELIELGRAEAGPLKVEHFRSVDKLFTFRSAVCDAAGVDVERVVGFLRAYEACFRRLGDMSGGNDE